MRKIIFCLLLCLLVFAAGCSKKENAGEAISGQEPAGASVETEASSADNREMLAEALGISTDSRNIGFIVSCLETVQAGNLRSAELSEENGNKILFVTAEDGTKYEIFLTAGDTVDSVRNMDTGEWPFRSER